MALTWAWLGAATPSSFTVSAKIAGTSARLAVSTSPDLSNPTFHASAAPNAQGVARLSATGLSASTQYYWAVEDDGVQDLDWQGKAKTLPPQGQPATYTFAVSSCAGLTGSDTGGNDYIASGVSNRPVFDRIRELAPDFFCHLGDAHYRNIATADISLYRNAYNDLLTFNGTQGASARQGLLYRHVPVAYVWDDHDYGPNNSDSTHVGKLQAAQAYREIVPHYPLANPSEDQGVYHSFQVGRVLHVMLDDRFYRDPNANPDGPSHTMLGSAQKTWLRNLLESSGAAFLCVFSQVDWLRTANTDSWFGFATERNELAAMFSDTGWADRMCMFVGDRHTMGHSSGATNSWGGFPVFMYGSLDSNPGVSSDSQYDLGITGGRDRFGLIEIADTGDQITVTAKGYIGSSVWSTHSFSVAATAPTDPTPTPPVAVAEARNAVTWLGCELESGNVIAELPDITGTISRAVAAYTSANLKMPIPVAGPGSIPIDVWEPATRQGETMIVAVVNDVPTWAGAVVIRQGGTEGELELACVSLEGLLDRAYVGDHTWTANDEASTIAAGLIGDANLAGAGFTIDAPATGVLRNRVYYDKDDATVYSRLRELAGVQGGPEFTVDIDWTDSTKTAIKKIVRVRPRIGKESPEPDTVFMTTAPSVFDSRGSAEASYTFTEDFSEGKGSRYVIATGSGEGEDRPQSDPASDVPAGKFRWEHRFTPSTSISEKSTLNEHAQAELPRLLGGSNTFQVTARWDSTPRLNLDWALGDDVAWDLIGHRHPNGVRGQGRVIAWELDMPSGLVRPILTGIHTDLRPIDEETLVKSGTFSGTPDSSGFVTINHNAGFTPANVVVMGESPMTGLGKPMNLLRDQITATTVRVRVLGADGNAITTSVTLGWTAVEG